MSRFNAAQRRYNRSVLVLSVIYAVVLISAIAFFRNNSPTGMTAFAAAILPALPVVGFFVVMGRYLLEEQDEYVRMLTVRQILWATGFALSVATIWGFLESFDLVNHVDSYYVAVLWFAGLGLGSCMNRLTLGPAERG